MSDPQPTRESIYAGVEEWMGEPDHVVELRHDGADEGLLREIDVAFYIPTGNPRDDDITMAVTVGLGCHAVPPSGERVELVLEAKGTLAPEERSRTARDLANFIIARLRQGLPLDAPTVVAGTSVYPFTRMSHLLIKDWTTTPEYLPDVDPPVRMLRVIPLHESESRVAEEKGALAIIPLKSAGAVFEDYERGPAV